MRSLILVAGLCAQHGLAQYSASQSMVSGATSTAGQPSMTTTMGLDDLWNLYVGPVSMAAINTTVSPTPVPSSSLIRPPPLSYPAFPQGAQVPAMAKNESWSFPPDFFFGVASAAYQVEGAVRDEGRGPSTWDVLTHRIADYIADNTTGVGYVLERCRTNKTNAGASFVDRFRHDVNMLTTSIDVVDNHYYLYKQDIARLAAIGVPTYSFTISWTRIFPFGSGPMNEAGLAHYDDVINTCIEYGIEPAVTLYHWDLPLYLQDTYGGWLNEQMVEDFTNYAKVVFERYGDRVHRWFTLNEPIVFCTQQYPLPDGYFKSIEPAIPAAQQPYVCGQNALLAHSSAYRLAKSMGINGTITFKNNGGHKLPLTSSDADAEATQRAWDFNEGWFATPVFLTGDYPTYLKQYVSSFLPDFTPVQKAQILGSADFFAHDSYTALFYMAPDDGIQGCVSNSSNPLYPACFNQSYTYAEDEGGWLIGPAADVGSPWLHKATDWVPALMHYFADTWKPAGGIAVTEFGFSEPYEQLRTLRPDILTDTLRSAYYSDFINGMLIAISEGVNVIGCIGWSIMDNFEWREGVSTKFGMQYVNYTTQERAYKASFFHFVDGIKAYMPSDNSTMRM